MDKYQRILRQYWGHDDFRGIQRDIIESIDQGRDTLGLMPTGGGKSVTFQVPALLNDGVCIVVTPLIALMKDQVAHLRQKGILASAVYSGMTYQEILTTLENCVLGGVKILYVSPERLSSNLFQTKLRHMEVSFITVDEAHCISQWGYDFRPSYLEIKQIRTIKPDAPILALTATATPEVTSDIQHQLAFKEENVFRMSFERKNLAYVVRKTTDKYGELIHILKAIRGCAIVYVRSRKRAKDIAQYINNEGISATFYHAGLDPEVKDERQQMWQDDKARVMVATNAFGMGIDKPDVRLVIHIDLPDSIEAYFQEAGRAGRDGGKSFAVLLYNESDHRKLSKRIGDTYPEKDYIREVYDHLCYFYEIGIGSGAGCLFEFDIDKFCRSFKHFPIQVDSSLQLLDRCGYIEYDVTPDTSSRVLFLLNRDELYRLQQVTAEEEKVITSLLRNYGGLFVDYCHINERKVAKHADMTPEHVYEILKGLSRKHIIDFIPRRKMPTICYSQRREDGENLIIPSMVYEDRKAQFTTRIEAMISYATNDSICRSRQLLDYFGEASKDDCGHCDVCVSHRKGHLNEQSTRPVREQLLDMLSDGKRHHLQEILKMHLPTDKIKVTMAALVSEEIIVVEGGYIRKKP
jgi:ATP-dependent DNA helicase RecQ